MFYNLQIRLKGLEIKTIKVPRVPQIIVHNCLVSIFIGKESFQAVVLCYGNTREREKSFLI